MGGKNSLLNESWCHDVFTYIGRCSDPGPVLNAVRSPATGPYVLGSRVMYQCNEGYLLQGPTTITCMNNGVWNSERRPTCVHVYGGKNFKSL